MQNKLSMSTKSKAVAQALAKCEVGKPKTITLEVVPTRNDAEAFEATVKRLVNVDYEDGEEGEEEEEEVKGPTEY